MAKESSASRSARVKFQLRDRKGRWIEMGRGVKWYSPRLGREVSGTVVGAKGRNAVVDLTSEPMGANGKPQQVSVKGKDIEVIDSKASLNPDADTVKATNDLLKQADAERRARMAGPKAEIRSEVRAPVMEDEDEDLDAPEEDPDLADLEGADADLDLDEDLDTDAADEGAEDAPDGPTDRETMEATFEELEAVVEEVASGDLAQDEIEAKLAEEVYEIIGNDDATYALDVKKLNGKWSYRVKDSRNETVAAIPAEDTDAVDAAAKLDEAINGKSKAKASTTAKPKEEAPAQPEAETKPEAPEATPEAPKAAGEQPKATTPTKSKPDDSGWGPARRSADKQPKLDIKGIKNVKRNGMGDYESTDMSEKLIERLPVGTEISSIDTGQIFVKVAPNRWAEPDGVAQKGARELKDVAFLGEGDDQIYLPGSDSNSTDAAEIERLTAVLDKNAEEEQEKNRQYEADVKAREEKEAKAAADQKATSDEAPEAKTVEAPKTTTPVPEGEQKGLFPEPKRANRKTIAETRKEFEGLPEGTKIHFADAMGENPESYQKFKDAQDEDVWAKMEDADEEIDPKHYAEKSESQDARELLTNADMAKANRDRPYEKEIPPAYDNREAVRKEANDKRLSQPVKHDVPLQRSTDTQSGPDADKTENQNRLAELEAYRKEKFQKVDSKKFRIDDAIDAATKDLGADADQTSPEWADSVVGHYDRFEEYDKKGLKRDGTPMSSPKTEANPNTAKTSDDAASALKFRMDDEPNKDHGMEIDDDNNVTVTDPAKAEHIFNAAAGDTKAVTNRPEEKLWNDMGQETRDELKSLREKLGVPDNTAQRQQEMKDRAAADAAPKGEVVEGIPATALGILQRAAGVESAKASADRKDLGFNFDRDGKFRVTDREKAAETISGLRKNEEDNRFNRDAPMNAESLADALDVLGGGSSASKSTPKKVTKDDLNSRSLTEAEDAELTALEDKKVDGLISRTDNFTPEDSNRLKSLTRTSARRKRGNMVPENDGSSPDSYDGVDEVTATGEKISDAFVAGDDAEALTAQRYLSGQDWNTALRDGTVSDTQSEQIDRLSGFIDKQGALPEGTKLYRGVASLDFAGDPQVGDTFKEPGFMSTSLRREEAENFSSSGGTLLEISPRGGQDKGLSISAVRQSADRNNIAGTIDALEGEGEILMPRGTSMRVSSIDTDGEGRKVVRVDVVDAPQATEVDLETPEAAPERPEAADAPATPETDSDAPEATTDGRTDGGSSEAKKVTKDDLNHRYLTDAEEDELWAIEEDEDLQARAGDTPMLSPERAARKKSLLETQAKRRAGEMVDENTGNNAGSSTESDSGSGYDPEAEADSDAVAEEEVVAESEEGADTGAGAPAPVPAVAKTDEEADAEIASLMAEMGIERTEPVAMEGEKYPPTRQQQDVIDAVLAGKDTKVQAMAGTGKTSTLEALSRRLEVNGTKAVYIAFNKTVQTEAEERMPKNVEPRTGHSLAHKWASKNMSHIIVRINGKDPSQPFTNDKGKADHIRVKATTSFKGIADVLGIQNDSVQSEGGDPLGTNRTVLAVKQMVNSYMLSDKDEIDESFVPYVFDNADTSDEAKQALVGFAKAYWDDLSREDGVFRVTHDTYLKHWALSRPDLTNGKGGNKKGASVLYIDEAQDTTPVLAKVVADQNMQKVIVGDQNQAIYAFADSTDFLSEADADIALPLNKSWRFGPAVADIGNRYLQMLESDGRVVGGGEESSIVYDMANADAVLVRTNAGMIGEILEETKRDRTVSAPKGTRANLDLLVKSVDAIMSDAPLDRPHDDLIGYNSWDEVLTAVEAGDSSLSTISSIFDETNPTALAKMSGNDRALVREQKMRNAKDAVDALVEPIAGFANLKKVVEGKRTYLEASDTLKAKGTPDQIKWATNNFSANVGQFRDPGAADPTNWAEAGPIYRKLGLPADGWKFDSRSKRWYTDDSAVVKKFDSYDGSHDVMLSTAHKSKGLEWDRVRIGWDFMTPREAKDGTMIWPSDDEYKLAYVAVTRAKKELDPGALDYVFEYTQENGGLPKTRKGDSDTNDAERAAAESSAPEAIPEPEYDQDKPATAEEAELYSDGDDSGEDQIEESDPEAEATPDTEEEVVIEDEAPAESETAPESDVAVEPEIETGEEPSGTASDGEEAMPSEFDEDGLTPDEAKWVNQLNKAITEGYRSGVGNVKALEEKLDELYDRGAARLRGEDPDAVPEAAPVEGKSEDKAVDPAEATPEAEEEVIPEGEEEEPAESEVENPDELPEPAPMPPVEEEEDGTGSEASDGEEDVDDGSPTDLETVEATVQVLDDIIRGYEDGDVSLEDFNNALNEEVYILRADDGTEFELSMDPLDDGNTGYVLAGPDGETVHTMGSKDKNVADTAQEIHAKINEDRNTVPEAAPESEAPEAPAAPEAPEEAPEAAPEPEETPQAPEPEAAPEPAPSPSPAPSDTTEAPAPEELPEGGTAPAEPDTRPVHPVKLKAANYPDGTQIKSARTDETIEKTNGSWHVAGEPSKAADPMDIDAPIVSEMPKQDKADFDAFDGNIDGLEPGDIIQTRKGAQAAVIGVRDGKVSVVAHNLPEDQKRLRPNIVAVSPATIRAINKFATSKNTDAAKEEKAPRKVTPHSGNRGGKKNLEIQDTNGNSVKIGDTVRTAIGQGEVVKVIPSAGPNGSVRVRFPDGAEKIMRNNKVTNAAGAAAVEATGGDDPATMKIGESGIAADGREFLVGKGNKPIFKGDRVQLEDGRIGIINGIYAGAKSANVKMEDGSMPRKRVSTLDAIDYEAPEEGPDAPEDGPDDNGGGNGGGSSPDAPESGPDSGAASDGEAPAGVEAFSTPAWGDSDFSNDLRDAFGRTNATPEAIRGMVENLSGGYQGNLIDNRSGRDALADWVTGGAEDAGTRADAVTNVEYAVKTLKIVQDFVPSFENPANVDLESLSLEMSKLGNKYRDELGSSLKQLGDATIPSPTTAELRAYSASEDFSDFDPAVSKFNPLSPAGMTSGDSRRSVQYPDGLAGSSKARTKGSGEILAVSESDISDGTTSVQFGDKWDQGLNSDRIELSDLEPLEINFDAPEPDFTSATTMDDLTSAMSEAYPDIHFDFSPLKDFDNASEFAITADKMLRKYPQLRFALLRVVANSREENDISKSKDGHGGTSLAFTSLALQSTTGHRMYRVEVNAQNEHLLTRKSGGNFHHAVDSGRELEYSVTHEFGHVIDGMTGSIPREDLESIVKQIYPSFRPGRDEIKLVQSRDISGYSYNRKTGRLNTAELVAEAFADAELNASEARPLSKLIHQYLMERLKER